MPRAVIAELRRMRRIVESADPLTRSQHATVVEGDARDAVAYDDLHNESVGLVVTSPPYPNAYDYHLYHRFRLFWLGCDPKALRKVEIGSHLKNQSIADPIATYVDDMTRVLSNCARVLAPGRSLAIVVGDGLFHGEVFNTAVSVAAVRAEVGLDHVVTIDRALPVNRRSVTKAGRRLTEEQIVFMRRPASARASLVVPPNYALFPYERELQRRELSALGGRRRSERMARYKSRRRGTSSVRRSSMACSGLTPSLSHRCRCS